MKKYMQYIYAMSALGLLSACATNNAVILPMDNNTYSSVATGATAQSALTQAVDKATEVCKQQGKNLAIINRKADSQLNTSSTLGQLATAASQYMGVSNDDGNKMTLTFKCE